MIDLLLKAIDRVIDLARIKDKRLRARFEEIYKPSFVELEAVHADYLNLFSELRSKLSSLSRDSQQVSKVLQETVEQLRSRRLVQLPLRQKLYTLASFVTQGAAVDLPPAEGRSQV